MADDDRSLTPFSEWVADHARGTVDDGAGVTTTTSCGRSG